LDGDPTGGPSVALGVNQMLIGVATRKYARSVRLPDGDLAGQARRATKKSSVSRRFVALSTAKLKEWLVADLSALDPLVIQIDGLRVGDHVLVAAIGIDGASEKHVLVVALGATENAAMVNCWPTWSSAGCNQTSPTCSSLTEPRR
jgi:putative transposase